MKFYTIIRKIKQWNPSFEATTFASEKWPFKRGGLSSGVEINTFMFRFTLSSGLSRGVGLSSGCTLRRGSTVLDFEIHLWPHWEILASSFTADDEYYVNNI